MSPTAKSATRQLASERCQGLNEHRLKGSTELLAEIGWTVGRHGYPTDDALAEVPVRRSMSATRR